VVEIGGEYVGADQRALHGLARSLGVDTFPAYDEGDRLFEHGGRVRRYGGRLPPLGPLALADLGQAAWRLERMARTLPDGAPWRAPHAERWDRETLGAWIRRNARTRVGRALLEAGAETIWPLGPDEVSLLHALVLHPLRRRARSARRDLGRRARETLRRRFLGARGPALSQARGADPAWVRSHPHLLVTGGRANRCRQH